jgi:uncharacterized protein YndB with AHSA1/START domain
VVPSSANHVTRTIRIAARPETVFAFFTDPAKMCLWKGIEAELDPTPGGLYRVNVTGRDIARGEYVEIVPYSRIVFTWGWERGDNHLVPPGSSTVEVTLSQDGDGTVLRLTHRDLPQGHHAGHDGGWEHYLARLAAAAAGRNPGPDSWAARAARSATA